MKSLVESIFGDNIKSAIKINGVEIYEPDWKLAKEFYQKRRKKYFGNKSTVELGDMQYEYKVVYNEDDCIVAVTEGEDQIRTIYILSPETIYMRHEASEICDGRYYVFSYNDIDVANDFDIEFSWDEFRRPSPWNGFTYPQYVKKLKEAGFDKVEGYIPETISSKAQNIIKKYMKD